MTGVQLAGAALVILAIVWAAVPGRRAGVP
jgi:hypothetical protein